MRSDLHGSIIEDSPRYSFRKLNDLVVPSPATLSWMKDVVSLRDSRVMSSTFESAIRAENTFDLQRLNEFVVGIIDRMVLALFARCYKSREGSPRVALIVPLDAVRALQIERNRKRSTAISKTRRASETSRYADLAKILGITVPPCLAFLVLHSNQSFVPLERYRA